MRPRSTAACGNSREVTNATPQQRRFSIVGRLADLAAKILKVKPHCTYGDLKEELKQQAANEAIPYFDAWPGASAPIDEAITIAMERRKQR
jgi:hypothetical protein